MSTISKGAKVVVSPGQQAFERKDDKSSHFYDDAVLQRPG
jgi:hypothetical protein